MRRVIIIAAASLSLAGCASFSDTFKSAPAPVTVQLDSNPQGADAKTSLGPSCKTPCSIPVSTEGSFSVTYTLPKYQPLTMPVTVTRTPGDMFNAGTTSIDPNPVMAELQPATPPKRAVRRPVRHRKPAAAAPAAAPADADPAPAAGTPFPAPAGTPPTR